jgi:hypothetical protein
MQCSKKFIGFGPANNGTPEASGIYLGSLDGGEPKRLTAANSNGAYLAPGNSLQETLMWDIVIMISRS